MDAEPRVLHLFSSAGLYGAEYVVLGLVPALVGLGIDSTLLCLDNYLLSEQTLYERAVTMNVPAQRVPCAGRFDPATVRALRAVIAQRPNTLLHVHGYKTAFYAWLAQRHGKPPIVSTMHGHTGNTPSVRLYSRLELWLMRRFDHICIVSDEMRTPLAAAGVPPQRISLVENGIDTTCFRPDLEPYSRAQLGIPTDAFVFGGVMRLSSEKNPLGLLEAFAQVATRAPRVWLTIAGDGPLRAAVTGRAAELGIAERVRLLGVREDLEHYYPMLDCFVVPSHTEGLPLALLEAMSTQRPVVSTAVGQVPTVLANLPAAQIVPIADTPALASAMQDIMDNQSPRPELRQRVIERYSVLRMAQGYAAIYRDLWSQHVHATA